MLESIRYFQVKLKNIIIRKSLKEHQNKEIIDEGTDIKSRKGTGEQGALTKLFPEIIDSTAEFIK